MKKRITTIWHGQVGIPDKYVNEALEKGEDLCLFKDNDVLLIPNDMIKSAIVGKSDSQMRDRYGRENYYLIYFDWKPTTIQKKLL